MTIFAVVALDQGQSAPLHTAVNTLFKDKHFQVAVGHYLVNAVGTAQDISNQLELGTGKVGQAIVYNIAGYFGYGPNTTWEWLKANMTTGGATGASGG
jgi:hypothetical protein